jgi:tetratricopeptide (TPR) repeat protein
MKRKRVRQIIILFILCLSLPVFSQNAHAETKEIYAEGFYNMGDGETPSAAEMMALQNAKRIAIEEAGTYVQSYSKIQNYQLTEDEVLTVASGIIQVTILDKQRVVAGDNFKFIVRIKAVITTDNIELIAKRLKADSSIDRVGYKDLEKKTNEVDTLKQKISIAPEPEKKVIRMQIQQKEKVINAITLFEEGNRARAIGEYAIAINFYTQAISYNTNYAKAYLNRAQSYMALDQTYLAEQDFKTAVELNPDFVIAHWHLGCIYDRRGGSNQALDEYRAFAYTKDVNAQKEYADKIDIAYKRIANLERYIDQKKYSRRNNVNILF